ncbi:MAG: type II secretion system secretin GspD [Myxococcota bacterium]
MHRRARRVAIAALLLSWGGVLGVRAQETQTSPSTAPAAPPEPAARGGETVTLDFKDAELADVITTIARLTHRNFLFDDRVRGTVTVISPEPVTLDEAYRVFESILQVKGFTTVAGPGGILKIIPLRDAKESAIETVPPSGKVANRDLYITRLIPLHYVKAEAITNTLRPLVSKDANMVAYAPTNTIILTDASTNVRRLLTIISQIDVASYQERIKVIPIQFADASALAAHLDQIFSGGAAPARRTPRVRGRAPAAARAATAISVFGEAGRPRFITDERTNSIIVIASQATIRRVGELIELLDFQRKGSGRIHVVRLQNADAEEMAQTLASLTGGGAGGGAAGAAGGQAGAPALQTGLVAQLQGGIRLTADAPTNSLIVQATAEGFRALRDVIEALDTKRPQVMVEALIMEVNLDNKADLGAGVLFQGLINGREDSRVVFGSDTGSTAIGGGGPASNPSAEGLFTGSPGQFTSAVLGRSVTFLDPTGTAVTLPIIQAAITASASNDNTNIISAPTILTADNEEAQIVIGQNIPIITSQVQSAAGTTGAVGSLATSQNVERQDVGVTLRVTPQISEGDTVRLNIFQEISGVIGTPSSIGPTLTTRTVEDTVYVEDGEAVIIGGILKEDENETISKVPFLGDIPILGWLFKKTSTSTVKTNLIVIITPHIVRAPGDLEQLTVENREKFRGASEETLGRTEEQEEARRKALAAGIALPLDPNPVRRELESHTERYPTEALPDLREQKQTRDEERRSELERLERLEETRSYRVHVTTLQDPEAARELLGKLIERGYDGTILATRADSGVLHAIELGPYASEERAQQVARELHAQQGFDARVIVEP